MVSLIQPKLRILNFAYHEPKLTGDASCDDRNLDMEQKAYFDALELTAEKQSFNPYPCVVLLPQSQIFVPYHRDRLSQDSRFAPTDIAQLEKIILLTDPELEVFAKRVGPVESHIVLNCANGTYNALLQSLKGKYKFSEIQI